MHPVIKIGDELNIDGRQSAYKTFDIVLFKRSANLIVHYVWRNQMAANSTLITRSLDDIYSDEEPVAKNEVVGKVTNFSLGPVLKLKIIVLCILTGNF